MVAAVLLAGCAPKVRMVALDAPDLHLPIGAATLQDDTPAGGGLGGAATGGVAEVLASGGVEVARDGSAGEGVWTVVLDHAAYDERVRAEPISAATSDGATSAGAAGATSAGAPSEGPGFEAVREGFVVTAWRLVDPDGAEVDRLEGVGTTDRWVSTGGTREEALAGLPPAQEVSLDLARSAGAAYARRLVPVRTAVARRLYGAGELRAGARALRADDVDRAVLAWRELLDDPLEPKVLARVHHDLAVAHELDGEHLRAQVAAEAAAALDPAHERCLDDLSDQRGLNRPLLQR